jgi:hypothetical protein
MVELFVAGIIGFTLLAIFGLFATIVAVAGWVITLPFKLMALTFKGLAALLALPFLLLFGALGVVMFGVGMLLFLLPAVPFVLMAMLVWWLFRRREGSRATAA